jgi:hypothetical protein
MPEKWFIAGTNKLQEKFMRPSTFKTTTTPHIPHNDSPITCQKQCLTKEKCIVCEKPCCKWQITEHYGWKDPIHAECAIFVFEELSMHMSILVRNRVRICPSCNDYCVNYFTTDPWRQKGCQSRLDTSVEQKAGLRYTSPILCRTCLSKYCSICEKINKDIVFCEGCNLKFCAECGNFQQATYVSHDVNGKTNAKFFCSYCIDHMSCSQCERKDNPGVNFAQCYRCCNWNCLSAPCTQTVIFYDVEKDVLSTTYYCKICFTIKSRGRSKKLKVKRS